MSDDLPLRIARWEADRLALVMQCAYLEGAYGAGAEAALRWINTQIENGEDWPELSPDWTDQTPEDWYDEKVQPAPWPKAKQD